MHGGYSISLRRIICAAVAARAMPALRPYHLYYAFARNCRMQPQRQFAAVYPQVGTSTLSPACSRRTHSPTIKLLSFTARTRWQTHSFAIVIIQVIAEDAVPILPVLVAAGTATELACKKRMRKSSCMSGRYEKEQRDVPRELPTEDSLLDNRRRLHRLHSIIGSSDNVQTICLG